MFTTFAPDWPKATGPAKRCNSNMAIKILMLDNVT